MSASVKDNMEDIKSGWYPNPLDTSLLRYWDGTKWSIHLFDPVVHANTMDLDMPEELKDGKLPPQPTLAVDPARASHELRKEKEPKHRPAQVLFAVFIFIMIGIAGFILLAHFAITDTEMKSDTVEHNKRELSETPAETSVKKP